MGSGARPWDRVLVLDISGLLTDDEIRGVTGYVGRFDDGKLTDLPTTEFYDSRHFKAEGQPESYDVGVRVWRLGAAAAEVQYQKLQRELPQASTTDEIGDASFRARAGQIQGLVFLVRERGVVVSLTCGGGQCADPGQIVTLGKLVESRLPDLPVAAPPAATNPQPTSEGTPRLNDAVPSPSHREETPMMRRAFAEGGSSTQRVPLGWRLACAVIAALWGGLAASRRVRSGNHARGADAAGGRRVRAASGAGKAFGAAAGHVRADRPAC